MKVCPDESSVLFSPVFANVLKAFIEQVVCTSMLMFFYGTDKISPVCVCVCVCVCVYENCALWGKVCAHDDPVGNVRFVGNISFPHKEFE